MLPSMIFYISYMMPRALFHPSENINMSYTLIALIAFLFFFYFFFIFFLFNSHRMVITIRCEYIKISYQIAKDYKMFVNSKSHPAMA